MISFKTSSSKERYSLHILLLLREFRAKHTWNPGCLRSLEEEKNKEIRLQTNEIFEQQIKGDFGPRPTCGMENKKFHLGKELWKVLEESTWNTVSDKSEDH